MTRAPYRSRRRTRRDFTPGPLARFALGVVGWMRRPLSGLGIDVPAMQTLLVAEMAMAERRRATATEEGSPSPLAHGVAMSVFTSLMIGSFSALAMFLAEDPLWRIGLSLLVVMAVTTLMLVTNYLPGLVDTGDIELIAATPVDDRTVVAARIAPTFLGWQVVPPDPGELSSSNPRTAVPR